MQRNTSVADWKSRMRANCLGQRARLALATGDSANALMLAQQSLSAALTTPKAADRTMLKAVAGSIASSALAGLGRDAEATTMARSSLIDLPSDDALKPREAVEIGLLRLRAGDAQGARAIANHLRTIGYRYPAFTRSRLSSDGT